MVTCVCAGFEYIGAGSNRNFCFTDLLLREHCDTDLTHLSAANWGVVEVKGPWQLSLPGNMTLAEAIDHPNYCKEVLPAVQQVCSKELETAISTCTLDMCCTSYGANTSNIGSLALNESMSVVRDLITCACQCSNKHAFTGMYLFGQCYEAFVVCIAAGLWRCCG